MNTQHLRHTLCALALLLLPAAAQATSFSGPPDNFAGIYSNGELYATVYLGAAGAFTGTITNSELEQATIMGTFPSSGIYSGTLPDKTPFTLTITGHTTATYKITASATDPKTNKLKSLIAYPATYTGAQVATETGTYTALFTGTGTATSAVPDGTDFATITIKKGGAGSIVGHLCDGTVFSSSSFLVTGTAGHELIAFDPTPYAGGGVVSGVLDFGVPTKGKLAGKFLWVKPATTTTKYYAKGFVTELTAAGDVFTAATGVPFTSGTLSLGGAFTGSPVVEKFTVTKAGVVTFKAPVVDGVSMSIAPSTGLVTGTFTPPLKAATRFLGEVIQYPLAPVAGGYSLLPPTVSGTGYAGNMVIR